MQQHVSRAVARINRITDIALPWRNFSLVAKDPALEILLS